MNDNIPEIKIDEAQVLNLSQLYEQLGTVKDNRQQKGKRYTLNLLLLVVILAKLCGEDKPYGIAEWAKMRGQQLQQLFDYHRQVTPSNKTIQRLTATMLDDRDLQKKMREYLHQAYGGQQSILITIDGKTLRGTIPKGQKRGVHLLAAYLPEEGVVLLQIEVESKENEIVAAPKLLRQLDLKGRVVSGDAMFTQRAISVEILAGGGDYLFFVKDNQPTLHEDIQRFFDDTKHSTGWRVTPLTQQKAQETVCQSGRVETRTLTVIPDEDGYLSWPGLNCVFKLERYVKRPSKKESHTETVFGITSLAYHPQLAEQLLQWTRQHWGIENGLHYRRDVTLKEDAIRMRNTHQAQVIATLNNFIVAIASYLGLKNLASARRFFQARIDALLFSSG